MGDLLQPWHIIVLFMIPFFVLHVVFFWLVCKKAGLSPFLSLLCLIPYVGPFVVLCVLTFSSWRVIPAPPGWPQPLYPQPPYPQPPVPPQLPPQ
jgi:hypothetical protein